MNSFEDFQVYFWSYIDKNVVSDSDRVYDNTDFCESVCFDAYRIYDQSNIDLDVICKLSENILFAVKRFNPLLGRD